MENWLLIIAVGIVFLVCMIAGYIREGISQNWFIPCCQQSLTTGTGDHSLSPYVSDALHEAYTGAGRYLEKKIVEAFMPEISADDLLKAIWRQVEHLWKNCNR